MIIHLYEIVTMIIVRSSAAPVPAGGKHRGAVAEQVAARRRQHLGSGETSRGLMGYGWLIDVN